jgi:hypothetical protein
VRYGLPPPPGTQVGDALETLSAQARKLGVNFFPYLRGRVSGARR